MLPEFEKSDHDYQSLGGAVLVRLQGKLDRRYVVVQCRFILGYCLAKASMMDMGLFIFVPFLDEMGS